MNCFVQDEGAAGNPLEGVHLCRCQEPQNSPPSAPRREWGDVLRRKKMMEAGQEFPWSELGALEGDSGHWSSWGVSSWVCLFFDGTLFS